MNRRSFLHAAGATIAGIPLLSSLAHARENPLPTGQLRDKTVGGRPRFALKLDGVVVGGIIAAEGGQAFADVIVVEDKHDAFSQKHIAGAHFREIILTVGGKMGDALLTWISNTTKGLMSTKNGSFLVADSSGAVVSEIQFFNGLITEIAFPIMDAASKDDAFITVKILPEYTKQAKATGKLEAQSPADQTLFQCANYKLAIDGLERSCPLVSKIEGMSIKFLFTRPSPILREPTGELGRLQFPDLVYTFSGTETSDAAAWHQDFVLKGNNGVAQEKTGSLQLLSPNLKTVLLEIKLGGLGIYGLNYFLAKTGNVDVPMTQVWLYCNKMTV